MDLSEAVDLFPGCGKRFFLLTILAQVLEFSGGILLLIEKAKTTLESMAADAVTDGNLRSGFPLTPLLSSGASRADPAEHIDHRPYLGSSPKGSSNLSL